MAHPVETHPMRIRPATVEVSSERNPDTYYTITPATCTCPDFTYRHGLGKGKATCKHIDHYYKTYATLTEN